MGEKKLKIAFLNIYQDLVDRGAETFVLEVSKRLKARGHKVSVFSGEHLPPKRWSFLWRLFLDPQGIYISWFTLKKLPIIWKEKYDVVIPLNGGWQPAWIRLITWFYGGKMVVSGQSGMGWDDRNNLWSFPNAFIALSTKARKWAKNVNSLINTVYIPNGVDINKFTPGGKKFKTKLKEPIILCVGALTRTKRIDLAIKAVGKLQNASLLVAAGSGDLKNEIVKMGKELLGKRFQLIEVPFEKMPEVYRVADVFTIPSESYYSFEIALVEAMATGLPVVANDDEIRKGIVGKGGLLVNPEDINFYSAALKKALKTNWGNKPCEQARMFSWDKIAKEYERLFLKL